MLEAQVRPDLAQSLREVTPRFRRSFGLVDGLQRPGELVLPPALAEVAPTLSIPLDARAAVVRNMAEIRANLGSLSSRPYIMGRVAVNRHEWDSYEEELRMTGGESLEAMIERYLRATSQDLARVFDWGCGYGKALEQMLEFDCVDVDGCLGTTADMTHPPGVEADPFVAPHLSYGNALYMAPVREGTRFNVLLSIYGANQYHPLNGHNSPRFGLLHAINIIEEGGLLVISPLTEVFHMIVIKMLVDNGVIEKFDYKSAAKNGNHPLVCIVRRKPTVEEILSVLSIDFEYRLLGVGAQQGYIGHLLKKG